MAIGKWESEAESNTHVGGGTGVPQASIQTPLDRNEHSIAFRAIVAEVARAYKDNGSLVSMGEATADGTCRLYTISPKQSDISQPIEGMTLAFRVHLTSGTAGGTTNINFGAGAGHKIRIAGSDGMIDLPDRYLKKDEIVGVVFQNNAWHVLGARLQTDAVATADGGYLLNLDFTEPNLAALRHKVDMSADDTLELVATNGTRALNISQANAFINFPKAPSNEPFVFRTIFRRDAGESLAISQVHEGNTIPGLLMQITGTRLIVAGRATGKTTSATVIDGIGDSGTYVLEARVDTNAGRGQLSLRMARWGLNILPDVIFDSANGGYKPLSSSHRVGTGRVNIAEVGKKGFPDFALTTTSVASYMSISTHDDTKPNATLSIYRADSLVGDARKVGIHYGGSGGGGGDFDDAELRGEIAGKASQNDLDTESQTRADADTELDGRLVLAEGKIDASRIKGWVVNTPYRQFDLVKYNDKIYYANRDATIEHQIRFVEGDWTLLGATDSRDIAYGNTTLYDFLQQEPTLHDDAVSTDTFNTTTGTSTQEKLDGKVDKTEYDPAIAGKATKEYVDDELDLKTDKTTTATIKTTADTALANSTTNGATLTDLANTVMALGENPHLTENQIEANRVAREANDTRSKNNETNIGAEVERATEAEEALGERITTAQNTGNTALSVASSASGVANSKTTPAEAKSEANDAITESLASGGDIERAIANAGGGSGGGTEGALVLEDLALGDFERLCGVSGADDSPDFQNRAFLTLVCDSETPTEGTASLGGIIRFTSNSAFNGKFRIRYYNGSDFESTFGEATFISGGGSVEQLWRVDGVEWDFANTDTRSLVIDRQAGSVFTPALPNNSFTYTFDGELTRGNPAGKGVGSVEAILQKTVNPHLVSKDIAEHPDVFLPSATSDFSGVVGTPTHYSQSITITDPEANPFETAAITFIHTMRAIGAVGSRQPIMTFQITQRGAVLFNGRFSNPSDQIMVAFNGYLNEPFEIHEQILWGTDTASDHFRGELKQIQSARKGALYDVIQLAIQNATQSQFNLLTADVAKISALVSGFGDTLQGIAEGEARNSEILNRDAMAILARAVVDDTNKTTDDPTHANFDLGTPNNKGDQPFLFRLAAEYITYYNQQYKAGTRKFAGIITNENPEFTYGGERLVWAENGRLKTKFRHNKVAEVRRDLTHYPADAAGDDAVADIVRSLSTSGAVELTQNLPPVNTPIKIYAVIESANGDRYEVITLTGNWLAGFTTTADIPEPSTGSVSLTARNNNGALALEYTVSGHNPAINASSLRMRALWVEPNGQIITEAADAFFEDRDIGAFNGQAIFGMDLDLAGGGNFSNVGIVASNFTLDTNWFPNAIEASPEIGIDGRGSILTDNAGMTLFRSRAVDAYTGETFATIQGYGDAGETEMGMYGETIHAERKISINAQMDVLDDTGGMHNIGNALRDAGGGGASTANTKFVEYDADLITGTPKNLVDFIPNRVYVIGFSAVRITSGAVSASLRVVGLEQTTTPEAGAFNLVDGDYVAETPVDFMPDYTADIRGSVEVVGGTNGDVYKVRAHCLKLCPPSK